MLNCVEKPQGKQFKEWKIRHKEFILENVQVGTKWYNFKLFKQCKTFLERMFLFFWQEFGQKNIHTLFSESIIFILLFKWWKSLQITCIFPDMKGCLSVHALLQTFHVNFTALGIRSSVFRSNRTFFVIERSIRSWKRLNRSHRSFLKIDGIDLLTVNLY